MTQPAPAAVYVAVSAADDAPDTDLPDSAAPGLRGRARRWPGLALGGIGAPAALWMALSLAVSLAAIGLAVAALTWPQIGRASGRERVCT